MKNENFGEIVRYGICGIATVVFSLISYVILEQLLDYKIANLFSIILTKIFAYITNKVIVFKTKTSLKETIIEIVKYIFFRGVSGLIDWSGQMLLVESMGMDDLFAKVVMIVITTIMNYFFGKFSIFKQGRKMRKGELL